MNKWQKITLELLEVMKPYSIAKRVCPIDTNKIKRWAEGKSIPSADEGPILQVFHAEIMAEREARRKSSGNVAGFGIIQMWPNLTAPAIRPEMQS